MSEIKKLQLPLSEEQIRDLKAGDKVELSGVIYTGRDAAHKRLVELLVKYGAIYLSAIGGAAALISETINKCDLVCYEDLGAEAIYRLEVKDFFGIVTYDSKGNDLFKEMLREKGTIKSLIALPENFFQNDTFTKSILVLSNTPSVDHASTEVFVLPPLKDTNMFLSVMKKIEEHLKK